MSFKIIVDSCGELSEEMKKSGRFETASLSMEVGKVQVVDDETFNQQAFLKLIAETPECPNSSCPSPERYMEACKGEEERVYIVTLSGQLSGSYNSAILGQKLYLEEHPSKSIHVFDSKGASVGETLIALKIQECEEKGHSFLEVVKEVEDYIQRQELYFVLENLDILRKNGRLTGLKSIMASALQIKPVMGRTKEGTIIQLSKTRGGKKALIKMVEIALSKMEETKDKILAISHCNCREKAEFVKGLFLEERTFRDVLILDTGGISSMYAADGGIIVAI